MPVSGNEEPGVLSRQSSSSSSGIVPLKKRWYSMVQPIRAERSSFSNENESKTKDSALSQGSTLTSCDSTGKSDTPRNSLLKVKEERPSGAKVDSQPTMLPFLSISPETNPNTSSDTSRNVDNLKPALAKKLAGQGAIGRTTVTVKKEAIANQGESHGKLELPANSGNVELSLGPKEPQVSSLVDPSLLSLSLNKGKDISQDGSCKIGLNNKAADDNAHTNRSNWDLNTPMDSWEAGDDASVKETSHISSASVIGANDNKGKQVVGASEQGFTFPISSIHPTLRYKSVDVLRLSLGSTLREFDSSALQSWAKVASSRVSTNSGLLKNLALDRNMNSTTCKTVKSEPVEETSVQANVGTVCRPAGTLEANVVKTEVVSQNQQSIELSTKDLQKLVEQKPMKCEPLQEVSQEISMTSDVIAHQSVGRVLQLQESSSSSCSSSSSSTLPMPLTPQQGCPSRLSTCSDLSVSGDLCAPSEYSVHSNEDNISKNALYHANADIAAKDANFDLKESNISSDNVEASVSEGMDIEDHMGYKKTQDAHNLVAGGERSANNEEKISISAGTEEECYGSDYESDGHHAFAGHVDTASGCGREDDEYEDGEVREPMMQSIAEDPLAEGMDSDKNNESSSKNAHCSEFPGVGESHCFNNDEKDYSIPVHTVSNDDFVKGCDGKAHKIDHKDGNLQSPLLDKEGTTRDNEQRPIGAIQQGPVDQPGIADAQEGCEKSVLSDGAAAGINAAGRNVGEANNENIGRADMSPTADPYLQNAERSLNSNSSKDLSNVGGKSRIINLPRASNATSPSNFRPFMGRSPSSRSGRERYSDMEEEKFHLRRNRFQDRSFGNSRGKFMRGRGRGSTRFNSSHREWDSGHDFESYRGVSDYRFRHNRTAAVEESEFERNDYDRRLDNTAFSSSRRRKPLSDALPSFRHPPARQLSPNGREGAAMMGIQMLRRAPRNISPNRCTDEDDSELGNTKFTAMQRRCFPRMRSKSPVRCHTRSLGPWSSPRRRSTEGFSGLQDSSRHRSPVMYRDDRMRSSPRTSFTEEAIAPRRRDSPSYTARRLNDMRDVDVVQEHSHPRSLSSRRSPSDRVFNRSNRRLEIIDRRERDDGDEYYDGPIHTGRCSELRSGGRTDERRKKYGERRGPRRMRIVEEEEGNFRQSGQLWHGEEFDVSRLKRRRFT
ncbi:uncharacterized protein LOC132044821 isoform X2 [Lycium ferocissimum]|uniref:uncharacterized protein LOC132044821 isoform X2 n=1 Tax=Lycium ferocissimum TaxID=112874 RepID=UPI002815F108|nr:uncharacterized protein LOC132044821 isoform X2 [Lycium ferocissimum]